jgi:hypothetical protein
MNGGFFYFHFGREDDTFFGFFFFDGAVDLFDDSIKGVF